MDGSPACKLCMSISAEFYCQKDGISVLRCIRCGFIYASQVPDGVSVEQHYSEQYFQPYLETVAIHLKKRFIKRIREIKRLKPEGKLLDIGSGLGVFMKLALDHGYQVLGVDVSAWACDYARKNFNLTVHTGDFNAAGYAQGSFDVITLWHVLEHVDDPAEFLRKVSRLLKEDGLLALEVPNIGSFMAAIAGTCWELMAPREHLSYFTKHTAERALLEAGFTLVESTTYLWTTPDMICRERARSATGLRRMVWKFLTGFSFPFCFFRFMTMPWFIEGDVVTMYAVKTRRRQ